MGMNGVTYRERDDETLWPVTECSVTCPNLHAVNLLSSLCEFPSNSWNPDLAVGPIQHSNCQRT